MLFITCLVFECSHMFYMSEFIFRELIIAFRSKEQEANHLLTQIRTLQHEYNQAKSNIQTQRNTIDKLQKNLTEEKKAKEHALNRYTFFKI